MRASIGTIETRADDGDAAFRNLIAGGHLDRMQRDAEWLDSHHSSWQKELL